MPRPLYEWNGEQYSFEERGSDWFWALGIIAAGAALTSILFGNILLGLVILAGAAALGLQASRQVRTHHFAVYDNGIAIDDNLYLYENMRDFAILEFLDPDQRPRPGRYLRLRIEPPPRRDARGNPSRPHHVVAPPLILAKPRQ